MPLFPTAPVRIQPYFGYRNRERLFLTARALRSKKPGFEPGGRLRAMRTMIAQFASHEIAELPVELELKTPEGVAARHQGLTDNEGFVRFDLRLEPEWQATDHTGWEVVTLHWNDGSGARCVDAHVLAPGSDAGLAVISDIDDTIIETGITGGFRQILRNWRRVVAQLPDERLLVPGADVFYGALGGGAVPRSDRPHTGERLSATRHPFFYVSSSPWNLFSYLVAFQRSRNLPLGPLMLRDWGLDRATFGSSSHGAHKLAAIRGILETYPELRFALIGDDTQGDLAAFGQIVAERARQIRAVFIRRAGEPFTAEELAAKATIEGAGVPLWLGESYDSGRAFLQSIGLGHDGEAEEIVKAVDKSAPAGDDAAGSTEA
ncbi:phosphatase domain-containing protein [Qipengyuania sp. MTN3-11]|uniref:phosphatase domain-containing protein n=1 Tax=Qipengyuania sp. MTN3-11 TaxID=3056557 RepID=UPI0036F39E70